MWTVVSFSCGHSPSVPEQKPWMPHCSSLAANRREACGCERPVWLKLSECEAARKEHRCLVNLAWADKVVPQRGTEDCAGGELNLWHNQLSRSTFRILQELLFLHIFFLFDSCQKFLSLKFTIQLYLCRDIYVITKAYYSNSFIQIVWLHKCYSVWLILKYLNAVDIVSGLIPCIKA